MVDEQAKHLADEHPEPQQGNSATHTPQKVAVAAVSAVLATSLVGALNEPPNTDLITLPEPVPIVRQYQAIDDDADDEDRRTEEQPSRWRRILKMLKYLIVALALLAALVFGVLKGCAGTAGLLLPGEDEQQEQTSSHRTSTEDERGVAVGA